MDFYDQIKLFPLRIESVRESITTEESTKMSLIVPFFQLLGYDVFNPSEFSPEYTADVGIKRGEKVDYAILLDNSPIILIEAKAVNKKLDKYNSQLFRYFSTTSAKFAILTDGIIYRFYTDADENNKMDKDPFLEINLLDLKEDDILELSRFSKDKFNADEIFDTASLLKYKTLFKNTLEKQLTNPSDDFVRFFLKGNYSGTKTQSVIEKFRPILKKSINDYINETINSKIKRALGESLETPTSVSEFQKNAASDFELEAYVLVKNILNGHTKEGDITYKKTESYFVIHYQNNTRKWIVRLYMNQSQKYIMIPDENKREIKYPIDTLDDINNYKDSIVDILGRYTDIKMDVLEYIHTTYGKILKPDPYQVDLTRRRISSKKATSI